MWDGGELTIWLLTLHVLRHFDPTFSGLWKICIVWTISFDPNILAKMRKMSYFDPYLSSKLGQMYSFDLPFFTLVASPPPPPDLAPSGNKPLPQPTLTQIYDPLYGFTRPQWPKISGTLINCILSIIFYKFHHQCFGKWSGADLAIYLIQAVSSKDLFLYAHLKNSCITPWQMSLHPSIQIFQTFSVCFEISIWNWAYTFGRWHAIEFHHSQVTLTYFTAKNQSNSFFCIHGLNIYIYI